MTEPQAWINGQYTTFSQMLLPVWDLGVVAGASITEMARTFAHRPFRLPEHLNRLLSSCAGLGFDVPNSAAELQAAVENVVAGNVLLIDQHDDLGIVIFITAGANRTYLGAGELPGPTVGIHTFRLPFEIWQEAARNGVRLRIPARRQLSSESLPVTMKTRNRLHWWLADREADALERGSRALLLDGRGRITETSTASFFAVMDGQIVTPKGDVLDSMSRRMVQEAASAAGIAFRYGDLSVEMVSEFQSAFLSSTPTGVLPVLSIDNIRLPRDPESGIMQSLRRYWERQTGVDPTAQILATDIC